jgi:hypothetical protein
MARLLVREKAWSDLEELGAFIKIEIFDSFASLFRSLGFPIDVVDTRYAPSHALGDMGMASTRSGNVSKQLVILDISQRPVEEIDMFLERVEMVRSFRRVTGIDRWLRHITR